MRSLAAIVTAWCVMAAMLVLAPPAAFAADATIPSDGETVDEVPVLQWPAVASATSYELQVSDSDSFSTTVVSETRSTPAYAFAKDIAPGTYYWRYRALAADGSRLSVSPTWSFTRSGQAGPQPISPVGGERLPYPNTSPTLRWEPIAAFGSYVVQWDRNPDFRSPKEAATTATAFTLPELMPQDSSATVYWRVRAVASELEEVTSAWSALQSFIVEWSPTDHKVVTPTNEASVDAAVDQVVYEWEAIPGAASYELQVALDNRFTTLVKPDTGQDYPSGAQGFPFLVHSTKYIAPSRYPAKSHWWRVRAIDANGSPGPWPDEPWHFTRRWTQGNEGIGSTVTTSDTDSATWAARPNNVTVGAAVPINEFEVTWDEVPDATYYDVQVSTDPAFHDGQKGVVCQTPHNYFTPAFLGKYTDAGREWDCPIRVAESTLPPLTMSGYDGTTTTLTVFGQGATKGLMVLLYFGPGDEDNGQYLVTSVVSDDPETVGIDESAFTVDLNRPGSGTVEWRPLPGFVLLIGETYYVRVRAVHEGAVEPITSVWSDQASYPDETPPGPEVTTLSKDSAGSGTLDSPSIQTAPATGTTWTDWPVLRWDATAGADAYLVAIAKDREFTNSVLADLGTQTPFRYFVTRGTSFVPQTTLAENNAGGSYYWYVLPCGRFNTPQDNDCAAPDREVILQSGRWRSFHKSSEALTNLTATPSATQPWVELSWDDTYQANPNPPTLGTGGFKHFEVQITESTWDKARTRTTETASLTTAELDLEPSSAYRWRVRAIDGGLLPLPWSEGPEFTMPSYPGPGGLTAISDGSVQPCLTWDAVAHASGYTLEIYRGTSKSYPENARVLQETTAYPSYCPTNLRGGQYSWRVRATHPVAGESKWTPTAGSDAATFKITVPAPVLEEPTIPVTADGLIFDWTPVKGAAAYRIELSTNDFWTVATTDTSVTDRWTPKTLDKGEYKWRVNALDDGGNVLSTSAANSLSVVDRLTITGVSPKTGPTGGGTELRITGTDFDGSADILIDGIEPVVLNRADNQITVQTPPHAPGPVPVTVTNPDSRTYTLPNAFTYVGSPSITTLTPEVGPIAGGTTVTVTGTGFDPRAVVDIGSARANVTDRTGSTGITVITPAQPAGPVNVTVTNPDGQKTTLPDAYTYLAAPTISDITPAAGPPAGGTTVLITGTSFHPDATVTLDGTDATINDRKNTTEITITTPAHPTGPVDVTVTNPDGQNTTERHGFTYTPRPDLTTLTPEVGPIAGGTTVTLTGSNFHPEAIVTFDGTEARFTDRTGSTGITVITPAHTAGPVNVTVTNPDGQKTTLPDAYTYLAAPTISGVTPQTGPPSGGTALTITGSNFDPLATVLLDGLPATVTDRKGSTGIVVTTPAHAPGPVDVTITNSDGQSATSADAFTYVPPPIVGDVTPGSGTTRGGTRITVTGTGFHDNAEVVVGGARAAIVERQGSTRIVATTPAHAAGSVAIVVSNPDGQRFELAAAFTYIAPPTIMTTAPSSGPTAGGTRLTIRGADFHSQASVTVAGTLATVEERQGTTGIVVTTPAHGPGAVDIVVTNPDGQVAAANGAFTYIAPPVITAVTPGSGPTSGYTTITVIGRDFDPKATLTMGDSTVTVTGRQGTTAITAMSPAHDAGPIDVIVTNPDGQQSVAPNAFTFVAGGQADSDAVLPPQFVSKPRLAVAGQKMRIRWSRPTSQGSPVDTYRVLVKISPSDSFQQVKSTSRRKTRIAVQRGRTYWVRIVARSDAGWGQPGPVARLRVS